MKFEKINEIIKNITKRNKIQKYCKKEQKVKKKS